MPGLKSGMKWVSYFAIKVIAIFIYALSCAFVVFTDADDSGGIDNGRYGVD